MRVDLYFSAALAFAGVAAGFCAPAAADNTTVTLTGRAPVRCGGTLSLAGGEGVAQQGVVSTHCNTPHDLRLFYPAELGRIEIAYLDRTQTASGGVAYLREGAPPTAGQTPLRVRFLDHAAAPQALSLSISPRGF